MQSTSSRLAVRGLAAGGRPGSGSLVSPPIARSRRAVSNIAGPTATPTAQSLSSATGSLSSPLPFLGINALPSSRSCALGSTDGSGCTWAKAGGSSPPRTSSPAAGEQEARSSGGPRFTQNLLSMHSNRPLKAPIVTDSVGRPTILHRQSSRPELPARHSASQPVRRLAERLRLSTYDPKTGRYHTPSHSATPCYCPKPERCKTGLDQVQHRDSSDRQKIFPIFWNFIEDFPSLMRAERLP
jgi:hypothetical protein